MQYQCSSGSVQRAALSGATGASRRCAFFVPSWRKQCAGETKRISFKGGRHDGDSVSLSGNRNHDLDTRFAGELILEFARNFISTSRIGAGGPTLVAGRARFVVVAEQYIVLFEEDTHFIDKTCH